MTSAVRLLFFLGMAAILSAAEPALKIIMSGKTLAFTAEEFASLPHQEIVAMEPHGQKERHYTGVAVHELLQRAGAPFGDKLRGSALQLAVIAHSRDGYAVVFALADFDEAFSNRTILLADKEDGHPLPDNAAPFRLITPGDKKAARWARVVTSLEVVSVSQAPSAAKP